MFSMASRCVVIGDLTHTHTTHTTERESLVTLPTRSKRTGRVLFGPSAENRASETNKRSNNRIGVQSESQVHGPGCGGLHAAHRACSWLPPSASYQIPRSSLQRQGFFFFLLPSFLQLCLSETPYVSFGPITSTPISTAIPILNFCLVCDRLESNLQSNLKLQTLAARLFQLTLPHTPYNAAPRNKKLETKFRSDRTKA